MEGKRFCFTRTEAAQALLVSPPTIDELIRSGRLAAFRVSPKNVRIPSWSLEKYILEASGNKAGNE